MLDCFIRNAGGAASEHCPLDPRQRKAVPLESLLRLAAEQRAETFINGLLSYFTLWLLCLIKDANKSLCALL